MVEFNWLRPLARWVGRQRWIRFGLRDRFARLVENPDLTRGNVFRQPFFGGVYEGETSNYIDCSARYLGAYSIEELELFADVYSYSAPHGGAVIDVGANVGNHSLFYALKGANVLSIEPNPLAVNLLKRKLAANPFLEVGVIEKALSDKEGSLNLSLPDCANL